MSSIPIETVREYDHIFFDFFDTVVHRRVHPFDVIRIWSDKIRPYFGITCDAETLYRIRMASIPKGAEDSLHYVFGEWMRELYLRLKESRLLTKDVAFEDFTRLSLEVEEIIEMKVQFASPEVLEVIKVLHAAGKKLYVVSDFDLPQSSILKFLENLGLAGYFSYVFVSCEYGKTKSAGDLFPAVLAELGLEGKQVFMLGDNYHSDCVNSGKHGIKSFHLRHRYNNPLCKLYWKVSDRVFPGHFFKAACKKYERAFRGSEYYFSEYALVYYFFIEQLFCKLKERGTRDVIFLSREGFLLRKFFEIYQESCVPVGERVRTHYLRLSRQAAAMLKLRPLGEESFASFGEISVENFLINCGFSAEQIGMLQAGLQFSFTTVISNFCQSEEFKVLIGDVAFRELYAKNIAANRVAFQRYYGSLGVAREAEVGVVDIGWTGRMQDAIHELTGQRTIGYYLGLMVPSSLKEGCYKEGLIFTTIPCVSRFYDILCGNRQIYEQLLMAPHGSAVSYSIDGAGNVVVNEFYRNEERTVFQGHIEPIQAFMLEMFAKLCSDGRLDMGSWGGREWRLPFLAKLVMRSGLLVGLERRSFLDEVSRGFVDNVGNMNVGIQYQAKWSAGSRARRVLRFLRSPVTAMRYVMKVCRLQNPLLRKVLFLFLVLPYYLALRVYVAWR